MQIVFKFDDGTEVSTKVENTAIGNSGTGIVEVGYRANGKLVPAMNFAGQFFTAEMLASHDVAVGDAAVELYKASPVAKAVAALLTPETVRAQEGLGAVESDKTFHGGTTDPMGD